MSTDQIVIREALATRGEALLWTNKMFSVLHAVRRAKRITRVGALRKQLARYNRHATDATQRHVAALVKVRPIWLLRMIAHRLPDPIEVHGRRPGHGPA
jgi:hypothetical protein